MFLSKGDEKRIFSEPKKCRESRTPKMKEGASLAQERFNKKTCCNHFARSFVFSLLLLLLSSSSSKPQETLKKHPEDSNRIARKHQEDLKFHFKARRRKKDASSNRHPPKRGENRTVSYLSRGHLVYGC